VEAELLATMPTDRGAPIWKTTIHATGVEVDELLRASIDRRVRGAVGGIGVQVELVHVRLYGDEGIGHHTCYIRVDTIPSGGGIARGDSASDIEGAVARAASRIGKALAREVEVGRWPGRAAAS
jgi:hypothetical protein